MDERFDRDLVAALARNNLYYFARTVFPVLEPGVEFEEAEYLHVFTAAFMRVADGECRRLLINMPPRHLKSIVGTVCFVAFMLGRDPTLKIMVAAHTRVLAEELLGKIRAIMKSEDYGHLFPNTRIATEQDGADKKDRRTEFDTSAGGGVRAVSFEAAPTGFGCDLLVIDDPIKANDANYGEQLEKCWEFFRGALLSRLNDQRTSRVVLIMQRFATGDLSGRLQEAGGYDVLALPLEAVEPETHIYEELGVSRTYCRTVGEVLHPVRCPPAELERLKNENDDAVFAAQYQQRPLVNGGLLFKPAHLTEVATLPPKGYLRFLAVDTATSEKPGSSYTAVVSFFEYDGAIYIDEVFRDRVPPDRIGDVLEHLVARLKPRFVVVEEANSGYIILDRLSKVPGLTVSMVKPTRSKVERAIRCLQLFNNKKVILPKYASWRAAYDGELLSFPSGRYSDQVDATTLGLIWWLDNTNSDRPDPGFRKVKPYLAGGGTSGPAYFDPKRRRFVRRGS